MAKLLPDNITKQVKEIFSNMEGSVKALLFKSEKNCDYCSTAEQMLQELSELEAKISYEVHELDSEMADKYSVELAPSIILLTPDGDDKGVRFLGIPAGHEFGSLLQNIVSFSKGAIPELSEESIKKIETISSPVDIKVFVTTTCPYCPKAVLTAHNIAMVNENVTAYMVEANEFQELSKKYGVSSVPQIVINDKVTFVGAYPEGQFVDQVMKAV
ncbi:Glutaredoxin-like domain protein [Mesotoga prima MesG1.Ag.4.2]|jgi:glutaredoxin-like protein|uniref:Glutaredoxin-like domain protein n=1 Tax=Mesotoga prima MesG1.Ag.4.2 TaxID=660470 RepID=I2F411_9BACT|nr:MULTISPECIES: thioredoxin family protein [Mesotoga]AFK06664.1 Glutaredoxin-like domain protein [Mesotoga prima MesG1.Ag.4.2]MDD3681294.1 thioredoxin family protein [Mesotoga sp.]MDD5683048.1 thioredoxin family protein [Mesotoga sp.]MDI9367682.1 thioredoxin family protein [Thermotogota bacterium]